MVVDQADEARKEHAHAATDKAVPSKPCKSHAHIPRPCCACIVLSLHMMFTHNRSMMLPLLVVVTQTVKHSKTGARAQLSSGRLLLARWDTIMPFLRAQRTLLVLIWRQAPRACHEAGGSSSTRVTHMTASALELHFIHTMLCLRAAGYGNPCYRGEHCCCGGLQSCSYAFTTS
jgi:hypothetical protein